MTCVDRETELQLVVRLRAGDPAAFDVVHGAFNVRLYNFLARLSNRRDVAEDLLEETWLRLVKHAGRLRPDTRLGPWLFTVARHVHASYCRSRLLEDAHAAGLMGLWPHGRPGPSPFEVVEASETERRLATALASLPLAYREAVLLVVVELCTLQFRRDDLARSNIVATALFGDGTAAAVLRCDERDGGCRLQPMSPLILKE